MNIIDDCIYMETIRETYVLGERFSIQPPYDSVRHSKNEGVSRRPRNAIGLDVSNRERIPKLTGPEAHLAG